MALNGFATYTVKFAPFLLSGVIASSIGMLWQFLIFLRSGAIGPKAHLKTISKCITTSFCEPVDKSI